MRRFRRTEKFMGRILAGRHVSYQLGSRRRMPLNSTRPLQSLTCRSRQVGIEAPDLRYIEKARMSTTKSYDEIVDFFAAGTTPEAVVAFRPSDEAIQRVMELIAKSKDGTISMEEHSELDDYLQLEHILILAKARARQHTRVGN